MIPSRTFIFIGGPFEFGTFAGLEFIGWALVGLARSVPGVAVLRSSRFESVFKNLKNSNCPMP